MHHAWRNTNIIAQYFSRGPEQQPVKHISDQSVRKRSLYAFDNDAIIRFKDKIPDYIQADANAGPVKRIT